MGLVSLPDYARLNGKDRTVVFRMAQNGRFKTATEISGRIYLDAEEQFPPDLRVKSGKYIKSKEANSNDRLSVSSHNQDGASDGEKV